MKTKTFAQTIASVLLAVLLIGFASAATSTAFSISDVTAPTSVDEDEGSFTFTFNVTYTSSSQDMIISFDDSTTTIGNLSIPASDPLNGSVDESQIITGTISNFANRGGETLTVRINATTESGSRDDETTFSVILNDINVPSGEDPEEIQECILTGNLGGNLKVEIDEINVVEGYGDDEDYWYPLDTIEVEVVVENDGDDDITDIELHWGLYSYEEEDYILEGDENVGKIKDGDEETITFTIELDDPEDFKDNGDFTLFVWTEDAQDDEFDGADTCNYDSEEIEIVTDDDFVILSNIEIESPAKCGSTILITADAWNVGDNEQEDVEVRIYNRELNINKIVQVGDIDEFDYVPFSTEISIPNDATAKTYALIFEVYDEDDDIYETDEEEDESRAQGIFDVTCTGGVTPGTSKVAVSASLESEAIAGEELVVRASIMNLNTETATLSIDATGYSNWAELKGVSPGLVVLKEGESKDVVFTFAVDKAISGDRTFEISVSDGTTEVLSQPVQVSIEKSPSVFAFNQSNMITWLIILIAIILVLIIVVLLVKFLRK